MCSIGFVLLKNIIIKLTIKKIAICNHLPWRLEDQNRVCIPIHKPSTKAVYTACRIVILAGF